ncbi:MAG: PAS domain-containing sensor histidine kinase [Thermoguttaceae bacterium]
MNDFRRLETYFAPAGRDTEEAFRNKTRLLESASPLVESLDAMPTLVMVVNANRQIVAANQTLLGMLHVTISDILGKRLGEALGCVRADLGPDQCGTGPYCAWCGAVQAILESQNQNRQSVRECRILVDGPKGLKALDLKVTVTPLPMGGESFCIATAEDIGPLKRLMALQRTVFHDILNTAGCIRGYARYILDEPAADRESCEEIAILADQLIDAIQVHRDLVQAESGDLQPLPRPLRTRPTLEELQLKYLRHSAAVDRAIQLREVWDGLVVTDGQLLSRVLGNMLKNALEATPPGGAVSIACTERGDEVLFTVHNDQVMSDGVQLQVFQRSFTTKGQPGRGIGTYSMKLFGERYLGGRVSFTSRVPEGTTFTLVLPKRVA